MADWRPLSARDGTDVSAAGPFEGVPTWMEGSLIEWVGSAYPLRTVKGEVPAATVQTFKYMAIALRLTWVSGRKKKPDSAETYRDALFAMAKAKPELWLDVADYWLVEAHRKVERIQSDPVYEITLGTGKRPFDTRARALNKILTASGSVYQVETQGEWRLTRRMSEHETESATSLTASEDRAAAHFSRAWSLILRRDPDPSGGYREAVKAVEVAAIRVVQPRHTKATLGTVIGELRAHPTRYSLRLSGGNSERQMRTVADMLDLLWKGQTDRHGTPDPDAPMHVTQEEAEDALRLALLLVNWFTGGVTEADGESVGQSG